MCVKTQGMVGGCEKENLLTTTKDLRPFRAVCKFAFCRNGLHIYYVNVILFGDYLFQYLHFHLLVVMLNFDYIRFLVELFELLLLM